MGIRILTGLAVVVVVGAAAWVAYRLLDTWPPPARSVPRWSPSTVDSLSAGGWAETFSRPLASRVPLIEYDSTWVPIFGRLEVDPELASAVANEGSEDGGDDYAFRRIGAPMGDAELVVEGWWAGDWRGLGAEAVVQPDPPHRLYEAALYKDALHLFYFFGPEPGDYETLAVTALEPAPKPGFYRIVFRTRHDGERWTLEARLADARSGEELGRVEGEHDALPPTGYHGIGLLSTGNALVSGVAVRPIR